MVDQTLQPSSNIRFSVIGSNIKTVTDVDNYAYFDYAQEVYIQTASDPSGKAQPPGAGYYAVGSNFSSTAPSTIESDIGNGIKYVFWEWQLPDGTTRPNVNLVFTVNQGGTAVAKYKTYYQLILHSEYPAINESSFEPAGSTATWNLSLHAVPLLGLWGFLGGVQSPLNASGQQIMNGPATVEIQWSPNYTMPIIAIIIVLLVIAGLVYLIYRLRGRPVAKPAAGTEVKEAASKAKKPVAKNFCPKCGATVDKDAGYCKKCGKKLR
jgi:ribosomal protein L40E